MVYYIKVPIRIRAFPNGIRFEPFGTHLEDIWEAFGRLSAAQGKEKTQHKEMARCQYIIEK